MKKLLLILVLVVFSNLSVAGETADPISFTCNFPLSASPDGLVENKKPMTLRFVMDKETKKSYFIGNNGSSEVMTIGNQGGGMSFIEITKTGNIMTTTITSSRQAVHSRNSNILGELVPSQQYGECDIK